MSDTRGDVVTTADLAEDAAGDGGLVDGGLVDGGAGSEAGVGSAGVLGSTEDGSSEDGSSEDGSSEDGSVVVGSDEAGVLGADSLTGDEPGAGTDSDEATDGTAAVVVKDRLKLLEAEGDAAADYLEELLDIADLDGDIDIFVENGRASLAIIGEGPERARLQRLVGRDGQVLEALQELTRMAVQAATGERTRLVLDIGGWREARRREAATEAERVITEVRNGAASIELGPMPAYQRKVVHDLVAEAGLRSESAGVEPARRVVVFAG